MWLLVAREPQPDMAYWPGRVWLAVADAIGWPLAWALVISRLPLDTGVVGPVAIALCVLFAVGRLHRAVARNHRYRFATWRWGKVLAGLVLVGLVLKALMIH